MGVARRIGAALGAVIVVGAGLGAGPGALAQAPGLATVALTCTGTVTVYPEDQSRPPVLSDAAFTATLQVGEVTLVWQGADGRSFNVIVTPSAIEGTAWFGGTGSDRIRVNLSSGALERDLLSPWVNGDSRSGVRTAPSRTWRGMCAPA